MALLIEAMDMLYTKNVGTFCLVSSDCDFTPLVLRLRSDGKQVIGFESKKALPLLSPAARVFYTSTIVRPKPKKLKQAKPTPAIA